MTPFTALSFKIVFFAFGLALGSFLNVVGLRYEGRGGLFNWRRGGLRSHCLYCRRNLRWYELVPLFSFFIQLGRCNRCHKKISWQYPLVELAGGLALLLPFYFYQYFGIFYRSINQEPVAQYYLITLIFTLAALAMILLTIIDWRLQIIPDQINLFLAGLGLFNGLILLTAPVNFSGSFLKNYAVLFGGPGIIFFNHILAALAGLLFFGLIIAASRGRAMGAGDMKLAGALGLLIGWPDIGMLIAVAFIAGAIWGLFLLTFKFKKLKSSVPFGPFIVIGFWITVLFGYRIIDWYFSIF